MYAEMTGAQLKELLRENGLPVSGSKSELVARCEAGIPPEAPNGETPEAPNEETPEQANGEEPELYCAEYYLAQIVEELRNLTATLKEDLGGAHLIPIDINIPMPQGTEIIPPPTAESTPPPPPTATFAEVTELAREALAIDRDAVINVVQEIGGVQNVSAIPEEKLGVVANALAAIIG